MDDNGTYLGNIYGMYKACIANISIDIYDIKYKIITYTQTQWGGRRSSIVIHVFSLVCFLIYGVKRRSGHDRSQIYGVKRRSGHDISQSFGQFGTFRVEKWYFDEMT